MKTDKFMVVTIGLDVVAWLIVFSLLDAPILIKIICGNLAAVFVNLTISGFNLAGITEKIESRLVRLIQRERS